MWSEQVACFHLMSSCASMKMKKPSNTPPGIGLIRGSIGVNPIPGGGGKFTSPPLNRPKSVEKIRIFKNERSENSNSNCIQIDFLLQQSPSTCLELLEQNFQVGTLAPSPSAFV